MTAEEFKTRLLPVKNKLYRFALSLMQNKQEAEDAVQEVYLKMWNMRNNLEKYKSTEALMMTITKLTCLSRPYHFLSRVGLPSAPPAPLLRELFRLRRAACIPCRLSLPSFTLRPVAPSATRYRLPARTAPLIRFRSRVPCPCHLKTRMRATVCSAHRPASSPHPTSPAGRGHDNP